MKLNGGGKFEITQAKYRLTEEQKQEDGEKLFDFCGKCLKAFTDSIVESGELSKDRILPLGFTVSAHGCFRLSCCSQFLTFFHAVFISLLVRSSVLLASSLLYSGLASSRQEKIDHGTLIRWTKGFGAPNTEGRDVVEMFRNSLSQHVRPTSISRDGRWTLCTPDNSCRMFQLKS